MLFFGGAGQIDPRGLDALMAHKISQERDVVEVQKKVFGKPVAEGVRIHGVRIDAVFPGIIFQLLVGSPGRDPIAVFIEK